MAFEPFMQFMRGIQGKLNSNLLGGLQSQNAQNIAFVRQLQRELRTEDVMTIPLERLNVVVFDIETTGFYPEKGDRIISIGAIKIIDGEIRNDETFYSLIYHESPLSSELEELTGISSEQLINAPPISKVLIQFFDFVKEFPLVAHHANHEKSFLQQACWATFRSHFKHRVFDTSFLYRLADPNGKLIMLEDFCEMNQIPITNRHHALGDARLTAQLWCIYIGKVRKIGCMNMRDIYERLSKL